MHRIHKDEVETKKPIDSRGTQGYYIISEQIKEREGNPEKLANLYWNIEYRGKYEAEALPFKLTLQHQIRASLFAAYKSKIENEDNDTTIPLFKLWKKIKGIDNTLLSKEKKEVLKKKIQSRISAKALEKNVKFATGSKNYVEWLFHLWEITNTSDNLLSNLPIEQLEVFKAQIKASHMPSNIRSMKLRMIIQMRKNPIESGE